MRDLLLVERIDGPGKERVTAGGIVLPAVVEQSIQTRADTWRGKVLAIGPEADRAFDGRLSVGDVVHVYTYAEGEEGESALFTGTRSNIGTFIRAKDIVCAEAAA